MGQATRSRVARAPIPGLVGAILALLLAGPALGHADLVASDPADRAVLASPPTTITLTFSQAVDRDKSSFRLLGPDGDAIGTGAAGANDDDTMTLGGLALDPGAYTIEWTSVAADGDVERGKLTFTVTESTPGPQTSTPAASQASPAASASATPVVAPGASVTGDPTPAPAAGTGDVLVPIVAALLLVAVVGALVLRRTRTA